MFSFNLGYLSLLKGPNNFSRTQWGLLNLLGPSGSFLAQLKPVKQPTLILRGKAMRHQSLKLNEVLLVLPVSANEQVRALRQPVHPLQLRGVLQTAQLRGDQGGHQGATWRRRRRQRGSWRACRPWRLLEMVAMRKSVRFQP